MKESTPNKKLVLIYLANGEFGLTVNELMRQQAYTVRNYTDLEDA